MPLFELGGPGGMDADREGEDEVENEDEDEDDNDCGYEDENNTEG